MSVMSSLQGRMQGESRAQLVSRFEAAGDLDGRLGEGALGEVATALADQFASLYDARPEHPYATVSGHVLTFGFGDGLSRFDQHLLSEGREEKVRDFRVIFLETVAGQMKEVVGALTGCGVSYFFASFDPVRHFTECIFLLDDAEQDTREQRQAILNWGAQVQRNARELRARHRETREAHARLREQVRETRERRLDDD